MYVLFGVPDSVLEQTWEAADEKLERGSTKRKYRAIHKLVMGPPTSIEASKLACNVAERRFSEQRLFSPGKILHITRCKSSGTNLKMNRNSDLTHWVAGPSGSDRRRHHELRWAGKDHFTQLRVMPRMILDHLPENILAALDSLLEENEERLHSNPHTVEVSS